MADYKQRVLEAHGFSGEFPSCEDADLCPGLSLPDIFGRRRSLTRSQVSALLEIAPPYFLSRLASPDAQAGEDGEVPGLTHVA